MRMKRRLMWSRWSTSSSVNLADWSTPASQWPSQCELTPSTPAWSVSTSQSTNSSTTTPLPPRTLCRQRPSRRGRGFGRRTHRLRWRRRLPRTLVPTSPGPATPHWIWTAETLTWPWPGRSHLTSAPPLLPPPPRRHLLHPPHLTPRDPLQSPPPSCTSPARSRPTARTPTSARRTTFSSASGGTTCAHVFCRCGTRSRAWRTAPRLPRWPSWPEPLSTCSSCTPATGRRLRRGSSWKPGSCSCCRGWRSLSAPESDPAPHTYTHRTERDSVRMKKH